MEGGGGVMRCYRVIFRRGKMIVREKGQKYGVFCMSDRVQL